MEFVPSLILFVFIVVLYFLPTIIASNKRHHNKSAILVLNLLLGWTLIGWIVALIWASTNPPNKN